MIYKFFLKYKQVFVPTFFKILFLTALHEL